MKTLEVVTSPARSSAEHAEGPHGFLRPAGAEDVTQRDLARELLRWPTVLFLPASVAILTFIGMHLPEIAIVPCGVALATLATVVAARRACAREVVRRENAALKASLPNQRAAR